MIELIRAKAEESSCEYVLDRSEPLHPMVKPSDVLWPIKPHTKAKHTILRKYLDAWLPILGGGRWAADHVILIDGFAGPGRYTGEEDGSPLIMLKSYLEHSAAITAIAHFFFIEEHEGRCEHLQGEVAALELPSKINVSITQGSFDIEFPALIQRLRDRFGALPPTFAFIDPFGTDGLPVALSSPLLQIPRCEVLVYFPVAFLARFAHTPEFAPVLDSLYSNDRWRTVIDLNGFESKKRFLHDLFLEELGKHVPWVRSFEITPAHEAGGNTYHLFFGTGNDKKGLRRMKYAMWKADPVRGESFRDSTLADHPVLFEEKPNFNRLLEMLREHFGTRLFTIEEAELFTLRHTPFRDDAHLKGPTLKPAEGRGELEVAREKGQRAGTFTAGTRMRFRKSENDDPVEPCRPQPVRTYVL